MSMAEVLSTLREAIQDPQIGFTAAVASLAESGDALYRGDFLLTDWRIPGQPVDATVPNIALRARGWRATPKEGQQRDAFATVDIGYEMFSAEPADIQANVALASTAIAMVVDALRDFSDRTGGTIVELTDDLLFQFGEFEGPTSNGFICTITLIERSTQ